MTVSTRSERGHLIGKHQPGISRWIAGRPQASLACRPIPATSCPGACGPGQGWAERESQPWGRGGNQRAPPAWRADAEDLTHDTARPGSSSCTVHGASRTFPGRRAGRDTHPSHRKGRPTGLESGERASEGPRAGSHSTWHRLSVDPETRVGETGPDLTRARCPYARGFVGTLPGGCCGVSRALASSSDLFTPIFLFPNNIT